MSTRRSSACKSAFANGYRKLFWLGVGEQGVGIVLARRSGTYGVSRCSIRQGGNRTSNCTECKADSNVCGLLRLTQHVGGREIRIDKKRPSHSLVVDVSRTGLL
jgi:hypothetical protein